MNYLAHMYLSGDDQEIMIGNFIADAVKGRRMERYPSRVQDGILLHRRIDEYTDTHEVTRQARKHMAGRFGKYSGVVMDMYYDHFLGIKWGSYSDESLYAFTERNFAILARNFYVLPGKSRRILPFMMKNNWLAAYASFEGLDRAFNGMARRTPFESGMEAAVDFLKKDYSYFAEAFDEFFPDILAFVNLQMNYGRQAI